MRLEDNGDTADGDEAALCASRWVSMPPRVKDRCTHIAVVLAAHDVGRAAIAGTDADDGDWGASQADEDVHALDDDAEQAEEERRSRVARLSFEHKSVRGKGA